MTRALLVDVDGVLIRGRPADGRAWSAELEADLGLRAEDLQRAFFQPHWDEIVIGRAALADRLAPVLAAIAPHLTAQRLIDYWFSQDAKVDEALLAELGALRGRGVPVHLATNQDHLRADYLMRVVGLSDHVDGIHYSADLGCRKPDAAFFRQVSARLRRAPPDLLLIDDVVENVRGAQAAGWAAIHWTGQRTLAECLDGDVSR